MKNVKPSTKDSLNTGREVLVRGAWEEARTCFEAALSQEETPEALEGLGWAAAWRDNGTTAIDRERAYRLYRERGDRFYVFRCH